MKWTELPVRMLRRDYVFNMEKFKELDLDELARKKKEEWHINCEWVMGTLGFGGLAHQVTFNAPGTEKYPPLGDFDILREYAPHAHKYGIKLLAYTNMHWYTEEFACRHPDWEQIMHDGRPRGKAYPLYGDGRTMCVNTPWREWAFNVMRHAMKTGIDGIFLDGPVVFPECCYCEHCRKKFKNSCGADLPRWEDWNSPAWKDFLRFREESLADFLRDAQKSIKGENEEGVVFLNAGSYGGDAWKAARNIEVVGKYQDFNGAEAFFHPGPGIHETYFSSFSGKFLAAGNKPAVVFMHHCLGPWHAIPLPPYEAKVGIAQAVASGANPWIAVMSYSAMDSEEEALAPIKDIFGFLEANDEYFIGTSSAANVALLASRQANSYYLSDLAKLYMQPGSPEEKDLGVNQGGDTIEGLSKKKALCDSLQGDCFCGFFRAMMREHIPFDVIFDGKLEEGLNGKYDLLILPNAACLSEKQIDGILKFMNRGGGVIASFETGMYDERGEKREAIRLPDVLGIEEATGMLPPAIYDEFMKVMKDHPVIASQRRDGYVPRPIYNMTVRAKSGTSTPMLYLNPTGKVYTNLKGLSDHPALVIKEGKAKSVYFPSLIGSFFNQYKINETRTLIRDAVKWASPREMPIRIDAPSSISVEIRKQDKPSRLLVHLVNTTGNMERPYDEIISIKGIEVSVRSKAPKRVHTLYNKKDLKFTSADGWVKFTVPEVEVYEVIVIE